MKWSVRKRSRQLINGAAWQVRKGRKCTVSKYLEKFGVFAPVVFTAKKELKNFLLPFGA
jgi:hypothetical protein